MFAILHSKFRWCLLLYVLLLDQKLPVKRTLIRSYANAVVCVSLRWMVWHDLLLSTFDLMRPAFRPKALLFLTSVEISNSVEAIAEEFV